VCEQQRSQLEQLNEQLTAALSGGDEGVAAASLAMRKQLEVAQKELHAEQQRVLTLEEKVKLAAADGERGGADVAALKEELAKQKERNKELMAKANETPKSSACIVQ
jgi:hypothetical protein